METLSDRHDQDIQVHPGVTDQAAFVAIDELAWRNAPPEDIMSVWATERSAARIRGSNLVNEKVLMGSLLVPADSRAEYIGPPLRFVPAHTRAFDLISDSTFYGRGSGG